jgi:hypothetical protein
LSGAASEVFDVEGGGHGTMLAQVAAECAWEFVRKRLRGARSGLQMGAELRPDTAGPLDSRGRLSPHEFVPRGGLAQSLKPGGQPLRLRSGQAEGGCPQIEVVRRRRC